MPNSEQNQNSKKAKGIDSGNKDQLVSLHQASRWFNECYADYYAQRHNSFSHDPFYKKIISSADEGHEHKDTDAPEDSDGEGPSKVDLMRMICGLMKENANLRQSSAATGGTSSSVRPAQPIIRRKDCLRIGAGEVHNKVVVKFSHQLLVEGKVLGSISCKPEYSATAPVASDCGNVSVATAEDSCDVSRLSEGSVTTKKYWGSVAVAEGGVLNANIHRMKEVVVHGRLIGKVDCERFVCGPTAQVVGNIRAGSVSISEGATIVGKFTSGRAFFSAEKMNGTHGNSMSSESGFALCTIDEQKMEDFTIMIDEIMHKDEFCLDDFDRIRLSYSEIIEESSPVP
eukprot:CAMPEP_0196805366 /NCGR_PEP_ID=MMETSP1362-20130617/5132_1 /TAXON_ID=163516 /ORGANISM="Leptocylindrus danicus, Strain CCMP1856" /LENGTH=341 /DNA_ID=CAMNT_0042178245 /DNA_START=218 /DNA_END=1243 /DNA_ORIENTATION=-